MTEKELHIQPQGSFNPEGYADLLTAIFKNSLSGLLEVTGGEAVKKIYFANGFISYASSNQTADRLGDILLKKKIITREQFEKSSQLIKETGKKQGTLLVQMGAIDPKELFRGLILQITEISASPFLWETGNYRYSSDFDRIEEMITLKINPGNIIREGLLSILPADDLLPLGEKSYSVNSDSPFDPDEINLSPLEKKILSMVPAGKSPSEISSSSQIPLKAVVKSFQVLTRLGFMTMSEEKGDGKVTEDTGKPEEAPGMDPELVEYRNEIKSLHDKLNKIDYYKILGIEYKSSLQDIKRAYIKKAKEFHPDRFYNPALEDISPLANKIFMHINEAYNTLSDEKLRRDYNKALLSVTGQSAAVKGESDATLATEQFKKGLHLLKCGECWESTDSFRWAVRLNPDNPLYHSYLGLALLETGRRLKEAEEHLKTAIALDCNNPQYFVNLGLVYKKGKAYEKASEAFSRALRLDPGHKNALKEMDGLPKRGKKDRKEEGPSILKKLFGD